MTEYFKSGRPGSAGRHYRIPDGGENADALTPSGVIRSEYLTADYVRGAHTVVDVAEVPESFRLPADQSAKLSFVGPEPEPAKAPVVTTPFEVNRAGILDSRGNHLGGFSGEVTTAEQDRELAALVVKLLNEHFGAA